MVVRGAAERVEVSAREPLDAARIEFIVVVMVARDRF